MKKRFKNFLLFLVLLLYFLEIALLVMFCLPMVIDYLCPDCIPPLDFAGPAAHSNTNFIYLHLKEIIYATWSFLSIVAVLLTLISTKRLLKTNNNFSMLVLVSLCFLFSNVLGIIVFNQLVKHSNIEIFLIIVSSVTFLLPISPSPPLIFSPII